VGKFRLDHNKGPLVAEGIKAEHADGSRISEHLGIDGDGGLSASLITWGGTCHTGIRLNGCRHHFGIDPAAGRDANMGDESERVCSPFFNFQKQTFRKDVSNRLHLKEKEANEFSLTP